MTLYLHSLSSLCHKLNETFILKTSIAFQRWTQNNTKNSSLCMLIRIASINILHYDSHYNSCHYFRWGILLCSLCGVCFHMTAHLLSNSTIQFLSTDRVVSEGWSLSTVSNMVNLVWMLQMGHALFGLELNIQGHCGHSEECSCLHNCSFAFERLSTAIGWQRELKSQRQCSSFTERSFTLTNTRLLIHTHHTLYWEDLWGYN